VIRLRLSPLLALAAYFALAFGTVQGVGLVGEVAIAWALPSPPVVLAHLSEAVSSRVAMPPFDLGGTRPLLALGGWPLAVNTYTGGLPDWPARAATLLTGDWHAGITTNIVLGGLLLLLAHRFLRFHGTESAASAVAWLLATDWGFVFYRKVLGGTETLLQAAGLLVIWALWSRRWKGGVHGTVAIAVGVGLGLHAKLTFGASLAAWAVAAFAMRWDRAALKAPRPVATWLLALLPLLCIAPLLLVNVLVPSLGTHAVLSHDTVTLQVARLGRAAPAREGWGNLVSFFGDPNAFFTVALGADPVAPVSGLRLVGFLVTAVGAALEWRARTPTASAALLRFLSIAAPLQVAFLFAANHDLHHLAQATPPLLLLVALAADRVAAEAAPPRSALRGMFTLLLVGPHLAAGVLHLRETDHVLDTLPRSTFTERGQVELVDALRAAGCERLLTTDYEVYGMIEARAPGLVVTHAWGALANGEHDPGAILRLATGGCYLSLRPTAPMIYDWHPHAADVAKAAAAAGVSATPLARLTDTRGEWAAIYRVSAD
jgi:hypothetical protein